jgi:hypothetical protein
MASHGISMAYLWGIYGLSTAHLWLIRGSSIHQPGLTDAPTIAKGLTFAAYLLTTVFVQDLLNRRNTRLPFLINFPIFAVLKIPEEVY